MRFWLVKSGFFPIGYRGIVLYPFVFFRPYKNDAQNRVLFRHELQHCYQIKERGVLAFYVNYLWLLFKHGYHDHPDEIEARQSQNLPLSPTQVTMYHTGKIKI